jgi:hypothetical protein
MAFSVQGLATIARFAAVLKRRSCRCEQPKTIVEY